MAWKQLLVVATVLGVCPGGVRLSSVLWAAPRVLSGAPALLPRARHWTYANDKFVINSPAPLFQLTVAYRREPGWYIHLRRTLHTLRESVWPSDRHCEHAVIRGVNILTILGPNCA